MRGVVSFFLPVSEVGVMAPGIEGYNRMKPGGGEAAPTYSTWSIYRLGGRRYREGGNKLFEPHLANQCLFAAHVLFQPSSRKCF